MGKKGKLKVERWDVLDKHGNKTGKTIDKEEGLQGGQYHLVVHMWILNSKGEILIQKRADHLKNAPGLWAITGGAAIQGEDSIAAARRETKEELGIEINPTSKPIRYKWNNTFTDIWIIKKDIDLKDMILQKEEVADVMWVTREKLEEMIDQGEFHRYEDAYFKTIEKQGQWRTQGE